MLHDDEGNLYGTTSAGGSSPDCSGDAYPGCGTVFKLDKQGHITVLHSFTGGADGTAPWSLIRDSAANLYGTAVFGAVPSCYYGCGTVFKLDAANNMTVVHSFNGLDGSEPRSLLRDGAGSLYGTSSYFKDGAYGPGFIFKIDISGNETILYNFKGYPDGSGPWGTLLRDPKGTLTLYGTTLGGGAYDAGTIFTLTPKRQETIVHSFSGIDGSIPLSGLIRDEAGNLYGATQLGGDLSCYDGAGCGVIFKFDPAGNLTVLHAFAGYPDDGAEGTYGNLVRDSAGNLYGATPSGGAFNAGTIYKLSP